MPGVPVVQPPVNEQPGTRVTPPPHALVEFLSRIRVEHAKTLLRRTDAKVIDIAFECGYSSSQYFANSFRQATGLTPSVYRKGSGKLSAAESEDWEDIKFRSEAEELERIEAFSDSENQ